MLNQNDKIASWVSSAKLGDLDAFEKLYLTFHKKIFLLAKRMTGTTSDAEDVVQETFVKAWQKLTSFRAESQFYTWLRSIATRVMIDRLRIKNAKIWQQALDYDEVLSAINSDMAQVKDLEKMIALLPIGARSIFIMHDIEGYKHVEIAEMTGVAVGTSKAQLFRARKLLRESLL